MRIEVRVGRDLHRRWHEDLVERLRSLPGCEVSVRLTDEPRSAAHRRLQRLLRLERMLHRLKPEGLARGRLRDSSPQAGSGAVAPDIVLDLTRSPGPGHWSVRYDGRPGERAAADALRAGRLPIVSVVDGDGRVRAVGRPGSEVPGLLATALADVGAGTATLVVGAVAGRRCSAPDPDPTDTGGTGTAVPEPAPRAYSALAVRRVLGAAVRLAYRIGFRAPHWRVGWRVFDATADTDALSTGRLSGAGWSEVADDGSRFYADPFPFEHHGRTYLFVEDFDHRVGKGVISVAPWGPGGPAGPFATVLRHDVHLSYPFVVAHDGEVWMIPETSGARRIELYRATDFPRGWELHSVLVDGVVASDATVFAHDGRWWMTATVSLGGSLSDSLFLWSAPDLRGPWSAHAGNPVLVDIASARPAGRVELRDGRLLRPVQDGRRGYGAAMSVAEITRLDDDAFEQRIIARYAPGSGWPGSRVHTLNAAGGIETIDGSRLAPRWRRPRRARP
ncbi:formyl transferase [Leucobacter triazinivorans]|uniref:Formyl transferase n=1 Tax=Leucobacter triazinivorans TaxID=1784719 RepID=A0A4P6KFE1_9MICO|nr:formyl transferase [Leucobacter triazinivorans]QBE49136.1 formyl transferase [Leucobacter triazinivorans]